jgi:uncharacterized membrane protein
MAPKTASPTAELDYTARPNCSLDRRGKLCLFAAAAIVTGLIALIFAAFGAWLVLPFAGLELALLAWALHFLHRRAGDYERVVLAGDTLRVETCEAGLPARHEFHRYWAQVRVSPAGSDARVFIRSHGREVELGRFSSPEQKLAFARQLRERVGAR